MGADSPATVVHRVGECEAESHIASALIKMVTHALASDGSRTARTADGASYVIRAIRADDAAREREFICSLSADARYSRLMYAVREPSAEFVEQMVHVDYRHSMAVVAVIGNAQAQRIVGVARYAVTQGTSDCEFAIAVADEWQARGVGTAIARRLINYARDQGLDHLNARILATNSAMLELAHWLGFTTRTNPDDAGMLDARLDLLPPK